MHRSETGSQQLLTVMLFTSTEWLLIRQQVMQMSETAFSSTIMQRRHHGVKVVAKMQLHTAKAQPRMTSLTAMSNQDSSEGSTIQNVAGVQWTWREC